MSKELIVNASLPEIRIALLENGEIQELQVERASDKGIVGNIYKGRVTRVLPGMQAAFVDIGLDKAAFLYVDDVYVYPPSHGAEEVPLPKARALPTGGLEDLSEAAPEGELPVDPSEPAPFSEESSELLRAAPSLGEETMTSPSESLGVENAPVLQTAGIEEGFEKIPEPPLSAGEGEGNAAQGELSSPPDAEKKVFPGEEVPSELALEGGAARVGRRWTGGSPAIGGGNRRHSPARFRPHAPRAEFQNQRSADRRVPARNSLQSEKAPLLIQDLLKEGQEVLVQVAKDPIAAKGARLTCHISLPGRHLVCMPTLQHVGVSRRIERDDERRRLRDLVERYRPKNLGFIVRTASGRQQSEKRIQQDVDYLTRLWTEIQEKAQAQAAPALLYEDLNSILRAVRDWVTEEVDRVWVDSKVHYQEMQKFASYFMPALRQKVELYHGDIPIFDAYGISTELSRGLERKVWLKSGGYIVIDQAEALVAIDVNTGRYVGKKNLEDTILKTNLEAVEEIAYQLRLRNCGGIIIIDFIDMEKEESRQRVYRALEDALTRDRARPSILKISELGLVEMTRKRTRDTMVRALCESCPHCEGKGFIKSKQTVAYEALREVERECLQREVQKILVQAHSDVIDLLAMDERAAVDVLEQKYYKQIYLQTVQDFHPEQFEVSVDRRSRSQRFEMPTRILSKTASVNAGTTSGNSERSAERSERGEERLEEELAVSSTDPRKGSGGAFSEASLAPVKPLSALPKESPPAYPGGGGRSRSSGGGRSHSHHRSHAHSGSAQGQGRAQHAPVAPTVQAVDAQEEEDRIAFLRAQAAQDSALAQMGVTPFPAPGSASSADSEEEDGSMPSHAGEGSSSGGPRTFEKKRHFHRRQRNRRHPRGGGFQSGGRKAGTDSGSAQSSASHRRSGEFES